jgi:hypothetical protein
VGLAMVAACGGDSVPDWPEVRSLFSVSGADVSCDGAGWQAGTPEGGPFTRYECSWENVLVDGAPHCVAIVVVNRPDADSPWSEPVIFKSSASCD